MKVIAINGSPKPKGNTYLALKTVCDELEAQGIETEMTGSMRQTVFYLEAQSIMHALQER